MNKRWLKNSLILGVLLWTSMAAHGLNLNQSGSATVCVVDGHNITEQLVPDFSSPACDVQPIATLNPQNKLMWVAVDLDADVKLLRTMQPLGLFISGKASSRVYLNGQLVGSNGQPASDAEGEQAGLMDSVFYLPIEKLKPANNQLILLLSAQQGILQLAQPIHYLSLDTYQQPNDHMLRYYWPSLMPFGVLLLGSFYLWLVTILNRLPRSVFLLPLMGFLASTQLFVEVSRGLYTYMYPLHDYRLLVILFCSMGFGLSLLAYVLSLVPIKKRLQHWLLHAVFLLVLVAVIPGFDFKSAFAIVIPLALSLLYLGRAWYLGQPDVRFVTLLLMGFFLLIFISVYSFLDTAYYYFVAVLIFLLMAQQAKQASQAKRLQLKYRARADQLQQVIDQQTLKDSTDKLKIRSAGKVEWVLIKDIAYCKGAGDYVELVTINGDTKFFHGSITELSSCLPASFLKTHRSYLVNTTRIKTLERSHSGAGHLILTQGEKVPISRRILPQVRDKLI